MYLYALGARLAVKSSKLLRMPTQVKDMRERLIVALDFSTAKEAQTLVTSLSDTISTYKVGKQLFVSAGPQFVREMAGLGLKVFLDLKFHDIPNTVSAAVRSAAGLGVSMLTVHASGGRQMLKAAVEAANQSDQRPLVLAVTVLTSLKDEDLGEIGMAGRVKDQVLRLAGLAREVGCPGIVASAQEAQALRQSLGTGFAIVTPGVRPAGADPGDQARVVTAAQAIAAGANYLVVGRPITAAPDPAAAARAIVKEMEAAS